MVIPQINKAQGLGIILMLGLVLLSYAKLKFYLLLDGNFMLALILMPFILRVNQERTGALRYGFASLLFAFLWMFTSLQSLFFFAFTFGVYFLIETFWGKLNHAALFFAFLCSPLSTYGFKVFGFPIRLQLTEWAGNALSLLGMAPNTQGNLILLDGSEFLVEPACTGLKMVISGMLMTLMILRIQEKRKAKQISLKALIFLLSLSFLLIIISNFLRLIGLVMFKFPEASIGHELIGIFSLICYTLIPLQFLIPKLLGASARNNLRSGRSGSTWVMLVLVIVAITTAVLKPQNQLSHTALHKAPSLEGYTQEQASFDGFKYTKENALLYLKPCLDFWRSDHNPIICWRGSGYKLSREKLELVDGYEVYTAELQKGEDLLYTAWWFQNNEDVTTSQLRWRMEMAKGSSRYDLVNVSCAERESLNSEISKLIAQRTKPTLVGSVD